MHPFHVTNIRRVATSYVRSEFTRILSPRDSHNRHFLLRYQITREVSRIKTNIRDNSSRNRHESLGEARTGREEVSFIGLHLLGRVLGRWSAAPDGNFISMKSHISDSCKIINLEGLSMAQKTAVSHIMKMFRYILTKSVNPRSGCFVGKMDISRTNLPQKRKRKYL